MGRSFLWWRRIDGLWLAMPNRYWKPQNKSQPNTKLSFSSKIPMGVLYPPSWTVLVHSFCGNAGLVPYSIWVHTVVMAALIHRIHIFRKAKCFYAWSKYLEKLLVTRRSLCKPTKTRAKTKRKVEHTHYSTEYSPEVMNATNDLSSQRQHHRGSYISMKRRKEVRRLRSIELLRAFKDMKRNREFGQRRFLNIHVLTVLENFWSKIGRRKYGFGVHWNRTY